MRTPRREYEYAWHVLRHRAYWQNRRMNTDDSDALCAGVADYWLGTLRVQWGAVAEWAQVAARESWIEREHTVAGTPLEAH